MHWIDWTIVAGLLSVITSVAIYTKRYNNSVADFLAANRSAGRYLLCICDGMAGLGAITIVASFEMFYEAGFPVVWWDMARAVIIPTFLSLSGWLVYRFRKTRALTLAQFFEMRYSKNFRVFAGILIWLSGIVNFGIFPAVGARFFLHFTGLPQSYFSYSLTTMAFLFFALFFTFLGGQIAVMATDFIQGVFCNIMFAIILIAMLFLVSWDQIVNTLSTASENASMLHPFKISDAENFNASFYLIFAFITAYGFMSWQGSQGYNTAARNAHEARMGKSLSIWRVLMQNTFVLIIPICAFTFMNNPVFSSQTESIRNTLAQIADETTQKQMTTIVVLRHILPTGIMGGFCAVMLAAFISTHDTYLHSWGSIFIQDVILPFRKKALSTAQHIKLLRWSIFGVAVFVYVFSLLFRQTEYIVMFFMITGAIISGSGAAIIGGLYWKRGTTSAAWASMITGAVLAVGGIIIQQIQERSPFSNEILAHIGSLNGAILAFWASISSVTIYVLLSLLQNKQFNLDKILHQGSYAIPDDMTAVNLRPVKGLRAMFGISRDFNLRDKIIYLGLLAWTAGLLVLFTVITIVNLIMDITNQWWIAFWKYYVAISFGWGCIVTIWFTIGGFIDLKHMFNRLKTIRHDEHDDGRVTETQYDVVDK